MKSEPKTLNVSELKQKGLLVKKHLLSSEEHARLPLETRLVLNPGDIVIYHRDTNAEKAQHKLVIAVYGKMTGFKNDEDEVPQEYTAKPLSPKSHHAALGQIILQKLQKQTK